MIEAGRRPEPELLEQIAAAGEAVVEPLLAILRSKPKDWPDEAPLYHALGVFQSIRHPAAIPEIIEILKDYPDQSGEEAAETLACYGEGIFDTLLNLAADPALRGYPRSHAIMAARRVADVNPTLRARLGDVIRPILHETIEQGLYDHNRARPKLMSDLETISTWTSTTRSLSWSTNSPASPTHWHVI